MRAIAVTIGSIATIITIGFVASRWGLPLSRAEDHKVPSGTTTVTGKARLTPGEQLALGRTQVQLGKLDERFSELDARLQAIEGKPDEGGQAQGTEVADADQAKDHPSTLSEVVLGEWMDRRAKAEPSNREWTTAVEAQFGQGLPQVPGVELDRVDCGSRFCRADLTVEGGSLVDMKDLLSLPVFRREGFTVPGEDGALAVYFMADGVSINELRKEAWSEVRASGIEQ